MQMCAAGDGRIALGTKRKVGLPQHRAEESADFAAAEICTPRCSAVRTLLGAHGRTHYPARTGCGALRNCGRALCVRPRLDGCASEQPRGGGDRPRGRAGKKVQRGDRMGRGRAHRERCGAMRGRGRVYSRRLGAAKYGEVSCGFLRAVVPLRPGPRERLPGGPYHRRGHRVGADPAVPPPARRPAPPPEASLRHRGRESRRMRTGRQDRAGGRASADRRPHPGADIRPPRVERRNTRASA
jgi:hypothetical protein